MRINEDEDEEINVPAIRISSIICRDIRISITFSLCSSSLPC